MKEPTPRVPEIERRTLDHVNIKQTNDKQPSAKEKMRKRRQKKAMQNGMSKSAGLVIGAVACVMIGTAVPTQPLPVDLPPAPTYAPTPTPSSEAEESQAMGVIVMLMENVWYDLTAVNGSTVSIPVGTLQLAYWSDGSVAFRFSIEGYSDAYSNFQTIQFLPVSEYFEQPQLPLDTQMLLKSFELQGDTWVSYEFGYLNTVEFDENGHHVTAIIEIGEEEVELSFTIRDEEDEVFPPKNTEELIY